MEQFNFTEWSQWRLDEKLTDLLESRTIPHGEERRNAQARYLSHLLFEIQQRETDER